ncbi:putative Ig domain-containing protein [Aestuariibacter sp. AA17]|uniref:Ig domain-containing protein n=1 Tax=Fluctibacter corallii TaxID=2984329 RepID=A0ABT3AA00_9ALTE|nr:putative Ig domain-containing protein [Aestuariibacter sp. AA17]MCV2885510.1 putative Ig domain-containing protein [Aestuariibacter sp. AA17]
MRYALAKGLGLFLTLISLFVYADNVSLVEDATFIRSKGAPSTEHLEFAGHPSSRYVVMQVYNGGLNHSSTRVSAAKIWLNGKRILSERDFNKQVTLIERRVSLRDVNQLAVQLKGTPGGTLVINIRGEIDNRLPVISSKPVMQAQEDNEYGYQVLATDADALNTLSYALNKAPQGMTINGASGLITWLPRQQDVGAVEVSISVSDPEEGAVTQSFQLTVRNQNDSPNITSAPLTHATEGRVYQYQVVAEDEDIEDTLRYSLQSAPNSMQIDAATGLITWLPEDSDVGERSVVVTVMDAEGAYDSQAYTVNVSNINDAPYFTSLPITHINEDAAYDYTVTYRDKDIGDEVTLSLINGPATMMLAPTTNSLTWFPVQKDVGMHKVVLRVEDIAGAYEEQWFTLTVANVNDAPEIVTIEPQQIEATQTLSLHIEATDEDGDSLTYKLINAPQGAVIEDNTGKFSWTPEVSQQGHYQITIAVSDEQTTTTTTFDVEVIEPPFSAPVFIDDPNLVTVTGKPFVYQVQLEQFENVTFQLDKQPDGVSINAATGEISWDAPSEGVYSFDVKASISESIFTSQSYQLSVLNAEPSHEGSDFWLAFGTNHLSSHSGNLFLYVSSQHHAQGVIDVPLQGLSFPFNVEAGQTKRIDIPPEVYAKNSLKRSQDVGIHVTTDRNVVLYALNQKPDSMDGFLVYPTDSLGSRHRLMTYDGGQVYFVATEDDTQVSLTYQETVKLVADGSMGNTTIQKKGDMLTVDLNAGEVYSLEANQMSGGTLTGSLVESNKPIAVFSGNECVFVPTGIQACDHLIEQMPPTKYWGLTYYSSPFAKRFGGDTFRIIADTDKTEISINGEHIITLDAGEYVEDTLTENAAFSANHPFLVAQYSKGLETDYDQNQAFGDPFMVVLTPKEQLVSQYQFATTDQNIDFNFVNIIIESRLLPSLRLNGAEVDATLFTDVHSTGHVAASLLVDEGAHKVTADGPFSAYIYGYGDADSYGYQGGIRLPRFSNSLELAVITDTSDAYIGEQVCIDISVKRDALPLIGARIDIDTPNAATKRSYYVTDSNGKSNHCYYGLFPQKEIIEVSVGETTTALTIDWQAGSSSENRPPQIVSIPKTSVQVGNSYQYDVFAVDLNAEDTLTYELLNGPDGMQLVGSQVVWSPLATDVGKHDVLVGVVDASGLSGTQAFTLNAFVGNRAPELVSDITQLKAYVGVFYNQRIAVNDPDGDTVYCDITGTLYQRVANPGTCASGALSFLPKESDIGIHQVTIRLFDRTGAVSEYSYELEVVLNRAPELIAYPQAYAKVGDSYQSEIKVSDPDGDNLVYSITRVFNPGTNSLASPANLTIDAETGVVSFTPSNERLGTYEITVRASDNITSRLFTFPVTVSAQEQPFTAGISPQSHFVAPSQPITLSASVSGAASNVTFELTVNGEQVGLDENGTVVFEDTAVVGLYDLSLVATDKSGNIATATGYFAVSDGSDTVEPVAKMHAPEDTSTVTKLRDIVITATDNQQLAEWRLYSQSVSSKNNPVLIASGRTPVESQSVYEFDPSMFTNGMYRIQLDVFDTAGNRTTDVANVLVDGNLKVGNFTYSVNEFTVPLAGLPISITRTYDSRNKGEFGDFGYGWNLDYNLVKTEKSRQLGKAWQLNEFTSGPLGALRTYCVQSQGDILIAVTLPNDDVERFKVKASPECNEAVPILDVALTFEPIGDTQSTLALKNSRQVRLVNNHLEDLGTSLTYDENAFVLTSREGFQYDFVAGGSVSQIVDPNGNTLTFDSTGITHSSGKKITFNRSSDGRINSIFTPENKRYTYSYSFDKNLIRALKPVRSEFEEYTYNFRHGLVDIIDSLGRTRVKNIYGSDGRLIAQEDTDGNRTEFDHDISGQQSVITDRNGNITSYYYDDRGNVTTLVNALNERTHYTYDARDNQLTETNSLGHTITRTFNAQNDLLTVKDEEGNETRYTYNERGQELSITDANGNVFNNTYDAIGNLLRVEDPNGNLAGNSINHAGLVTLTQNGLGHQTKFSYDEQGNKTRQDNPDGSATTYTYNGDNQLTTKILFRTTADASISEDAIQYRYDNVGRLTSEQDGEGLLQSVSYDAMGNKRSEYDGLVSLSHEYDVYHRLLKTHYSDESFEQFTYDPEGNRLSETDRNGNVTTHTYDKLNRVVKTTYDDGSFITMRYDEAGYLASETDENGSTTTFTYDKAGQRITTTNALGQEWHYAYDGNGNVITEIDPLGRTTSYTYDKLDRRISTTFEDATSLSDGFDALGRNISKTDQNARTIHYTYDEIGRLTLVKDGLNQETRYHYDEAGNKIAQIDAQGRKTQWEYDSRGRVTARILPMGQRETFEYDRADNVIKHVNFNGQTINYSYERSASRVMSVSGPDIRETFRYDANGNRTYAKNHSGEYHYKYDNRDQLIEEVQPNGATIAYGYDAAGNKTNMTTTYVNGDVRSETYSYDALNRLISVTDNAQQTTTFAYDAVGNQTHIYYANGLTSVTAYDALNRPTSVTTIDADENVLTSYTYTLDNTGRRTSIVEHTGRQSTFTYDDVYRLTAETITDAFNGDYNATYTYDNVGNRTSSLINGVSTTYTYDDNDRLLSEGDNRYTYDAQGNLTEQTDGAITKTYTYNTNQRLMQFSDSIRTVEFEYNVDAIRVAKSIDGVNTDYIVDSNQAYQQVIAEQDASNSILKEYLYGNDLISQNESDAYTYFHYDSLGTTRTLSDSQAQITDAYTYEAFGTLLNQTGSTDNDYLFTGEQYDSELDNYYLRARYYDQNVGRFTQMDTWMGVDDEPITLNKYIYAYSDGVNFIDPTGMFGLGDIMAARTTQNILRNIQTVGRAIPGHSGAVTGRKLIWNGGCFIVEELAESYISRAIGLYVFDDTKINKPYVGQSRANVVTRIRAHFRKSRTDIANLTHILPVEIAPSVADKLDDVLDALEQSFIDDLDGPGGKSSGKNSRGKSANKRNQFNTEKRKDLAKLMKKFKICPTG